MAIIEGLETQDSLEGLAALDRYEILDTAPEARFDDLARLAATVCGTPIGLIGFISAGKTWFKAWAGLEPVRIPREVSFCHETVQQDGVMVIPDTLADPRFANDPLVVSEPHVRFYAGTPLRSPEGHVVGALCVLDRKPKTLTSDQCESLEALGRQVTAQLELRGQNAERVRAEREIRNLSEKAVRRSWERL
ncbi:GAF domain-containing protein, partial [Singulisphaera rosea]